MDITPASRRTAIGLALAALAVRVLPSNARADTQSRVMPVPALDAESRNPSTRTAMFAGGCFWGVQAVFQHVKGVKQAVSGYAGGTVANPTYEQVCTGRTGHAESVKVTFDPAQIGYGKLLQVFFSVALDPTQVDRQGPDWGTQYRSEVFVSGPEQDRIARAYVGQLDAAHVFDKPIATRIDAAGPFYPAEAYHQDYLLRHPDQPYIVANDLPKVRSLESLFPELWQSPPVTVARI
jgi:peptide-methionine (S)-S-oxide reductase